MLPAPRGCFRNGLELQGQSGLCISNLRVGQDGVFFGNLRDIFAFCGKELRGLAFYTGDCGCEILTVLGWLVVTPWMGFFTSRVENQVLCAVYICIY